MGVISKIGREARRFASRVGAELKRAISRIWKEVLRIAAQIVITTVAILTAIALGATTLALKLKGLFVAVIVYAIAYMLIPDELESQMARFTDGVKSFIDAGVDILAGAADSVFSAFMSSPLGVATLVVGGFVVYRIVTKNDTGGSGVTINQAPPSPSLSSQGV